MPAVPKQPRVRTVELQAAQAVAFARGGFRVRPEHIGKRVWILPERPLLTTVNGGDRGRGRRAATAFAHQVVIDVDGSVNWPEPRAALQGSLELLGERKRFNVGRRTARKPLAKPLSVRTWKMKGREYPALHLAGTWLAEAGFQIGDQVIRETLHPGVLVLRVARHRTPAFLEERCDA